jgi:hypothetical protein
MSDTATATRLLNPAVRAVMYGSLVLLFLVLTDQLSAYYGLAESQRIVDDSCGGIIAGLLIYRLEHNRAKYLTEKLKTIELMNHHVRNALQVIVDSAYLHGHAQQLDEIQMSVKRIDWALREILPGRVLDEYNDPGSQKTDDRTAA